ncbi:MAG: NFACT family protein, partial [Candidatus Zixiibacteriota bacterium]
MQTSFHILSLVRELKKEIIGNEIVAAEFYRKERAAYFFLKKKKRHALAFLFHPTHSGTFLVPASKVKINTREKPWPIFSVKGATVLSVEQIGFDRIFIITIKLDKEIRKIVFEAIGPNGNIWLLDKNNLKLATLRKKSFQSGDFYQAAILPDKLNPLTTTVETLSEYIKDKPDMPLKYFIEKNILGCNITLAREIIIRAS